MFLASPRLELDFQIGHFADFEHFRIDSNLNKFGQVNIDLIGLFFTDFGQFKVNLQSLGKTLGREKKFKKISFDKKFKNHT